MRILIIEDEKEVADLVRRSLVATLNRMIARLEEGVKHLQQFTQDAAHELRTPLTILRGDLELAYQDEKASEESHALLQKTLDRAIAPGQIVDNLMRLARSDSGDYPIHKKSFRLDAAVKEILEGLAQSAICFVHGIVHIECAAVQFPFSLPSYFLIKTILSQEPPEMKKTSRGFIAALFVLLTVGPINLFAQTIEKARTGHPLVCAIKTVGSDMAYVFTAPLRTSKKGGIKLLALSAITAGFILRADDEIDEELALEGYEFSSQPFREFAKLGQVYDDIGPVNFAVGLTATTLAGGLALRDKKLLQTSRLLAESAVLTQLFTSLTKNLSGRARPYVDHGPRDFTLFKFSKSEDFRSMSSGHASSAFALMTVIAKQYDHWWVEIPAYAFAVSVAFQRMTSRSHWASDTIVGGALGYWVSSTLVRKQQRPSKSSSLNFYPAGNRFGVAVRF